MTNLDSILKSRHYFANKDPSSQSYVFFPVVVYGCESWTIKKAEHQRIDAFELWCWRRFLSPLDCKEIQPVHSKGHDGLDGHQFSSVQLLSGVRLFATP